MNLLAAWCVRHGLGLAFRNVLALKSQTLATYDSVELNREAFAGEAAARNVECRKKISFEVRRGVGQRSDQTVRVW